MNALLIGGAISMVFTLFGTPLFVRLFRRIGWGQFIRDDGPQSHHSKRGTPTMGGIVFLLGAVVGYFAGHLIAREPLGTASLLVIFLTVGLGLVGFVDDFLKVRNQRSLGLGGWSKVLGQVIVSTAFGFLVLMFPDEHGVTPAGRIVAGEPVVFISGTRDIPWLNLFFAGTVVGVVLFLLWVNVIAVSASNGVNVTDGLDGLATGATILALTGYIVICFWQFNQWCDNPTVDQTRCYTVSGPLDLAIVAACLAGSLIGFLWWNTSPAQIFMGDSGSLGLGGAVAALAILSRTELLLVALGGLFLIVTGSVIVQRGFFKLTRWRYGTGRRIFLMSPIQHHFELKGWAEVTIVVRFWLIEGLFVALGVGLFYLEWSRA
ncbi:phospho-N-acetylmuramoyl-pentapeptide-transferase [Galbitalea sp. SE-J8]|uniref:phospho-N-acetylmuramoyl-pentapeptide- transferase n=1 Tax=Galbitalea sp. SE-J8 TaxID=3054952 RepID=UPI00259D1066|nr:phospho-N-acetylmuramoyl-pentapeptide-transferase [Galbitalea sp. SE-J8]MDM4763083.1 phospho-N-acetylmuramoyl-pentapeptide-transferase [Galbitalea sp. SE-J8]